MHICFLCNEYPKEGFPHGGIGTFVKTIALQLVKSGVAVSVVGVNYENKYEEVVENGVYIYRIERHQIKGLSWFLNFRNINKCLKRIHQKVVIDIVETSELGLAFIHKIPNIKYIIRLHGGHHFFAEAERRGIDKWKGFQEKKSFKKADAFVAVSEYVKKHTELYLDFNNKSVAIINNPINFSLFKPSENPKQIKHRLVFVGTVCEKKGVRQLLEAFQEVRLNYIDATLDIYGRDWFYPDGRSYIAELQKMFTQLQMDKIRFMGTVAHNNLPNIYESANVCVFPSHIETQGLVAPEAMAMEKAVIFSKTGPGPETITDGETGFLVDPYNSKEIAEKIMRCFKNGEAVQQIGKNARIAAIDKFAINMILEKNIEFYKKLLKNKPSDKIADL